MLSSFAGDIGNATNATGGLNTGLLNLSSGMTVLQGLAGAARGVFSALAAPVKAGFDAVASYERQAISIQTLTAREIMHASAVEKRVLVGYRNIAATEAQTVVVGKSKKSTEEIALAQERYNATILTAKERIDKLNASGKATPGQLAQANATLHTAEANLAKVSGQLQTIPAQGARTVAVYKTTTEYTKTMAQAMEEAGEKTRQTLEWIQKLAILSPFDRDGVTAAYKTALTYGYTSDEAKRLTQNLIDFAAATGASSAMLDQIAYPLGQIRTGSKLYTQDLRQLMNAGVPVTEILAEMGYTLADVGTTAVSSADFLERFNKLIERDFGGAAKAQAGTFAGLVASLEDLKDVGLRNLFTPMFKEIQPELQKVVDTLQMPGVAYALELVGKALGKLVSGPVAWIGDKIGKVGKVMERFKILMEYSGRPVWALRQALTQVIPNGVLSRFDGIFTALDKFQIAMSAGKSPVEALKEAIKAAVAPEIADPLTKLIDIVATVPERLKAAWEKLKTGDIGGTIDILAGFVVDLDKWFTDNVVSKLPAALDTMWTAAEPKIDAFIQTVPPFLSKLTAALFGPDGADKTVDPFAPIYAGLDTQVPSDFDIEMAALGAKISTKVEGWWALLKPGFETLGNKLWGSLVEGFRKDIEHFLSDPLGTEKLTGTKGGVPGGLSGAMWKAVEGDKGMEWDAAKAQSLFNLDGLTKAANTPAVGGDLIKGIGEGMQTEEAKTAVSDNMIGAIDSALAAVKSWFEIKSPSGLTNREIGVPLAEGVASGILETEATVAAAMVVMAYNAVTSARATLLGSDYYRLPAPALDLPTATSPTATAAPMTTALSAAPTITLAPKFEFPTLSASDPAFAAFGDSVAATLKIAIATAPATEVKIGILAAINAGASAAASDETLPTLAGFATIGDTIASALKIPIATGSPIEIKTGILGIINAGLAAASAEGSGIAQLTSFATLGDAVVAPLGTAIATGTTVQVSSAFNKLIYSGAEGAVVLMDANTALDSLGKKVATVLRDVIAGETAKLTTGIASVISVGSDGAKSRLGLADPMTSVPGVKVGIPVVLAMAGAILGSDGLISSAVAGLLMAVTSMSTSAFAAGVTLGQSVRAGFAAGVGSLTPPTSPTGGAGRAGSGTTMPPPVTSARAGNVIVPVTVDGKQVAKVVVDRMTGMVYADGKRY